MIIHDGTYTPTTSKNASRRLLSILGALCHEGGGGACAQRLVSREEGRVRNALYRLVRNALCRARGGGTQALFFAKRAGTLASLAVAQWLGQQTSDP